MKWRLLEDIPFSVDAADFLAEMRLKQGSAREACCRELIGQALLLAKPRAVYLPARVEALNKDGMTANGVLFKSSLFKPRLKAGEEIYFFLATCGAEINRWSGSFSDDMLRGYWADCLAEKALRAAVAKLEETLRPLIAEGYLAAMDPGSLAQWPITEQRPLFALLGGAAAACGVSLNDYYVMQPQKSVSGFYFCSAAEYCNCELCPRFSCYGRRAAFSGVAE